MLMAVIYSQLKALSLSSTCSYTTVVVMATVSCHVFDIFRWGHSIQQFNADLLLYLHIMLQLGMGGGTDVNHVYCVPALNSVDKNEHVLGTIHN